MLPQLVEKRFDAWINWRFKKNEVTKFLLTHERKPLIIDNICQQVRIAEIGVKKMDTEKLALIIDTCAEMFSKNALQHAHENIISKSERKRLVHQAGLVKDMEDEQEYLRKEFKNELKES